MQLVNYSQQMLHASEPVIVPTETAKPAKKPNKLSMGLPVALLGAAVLASSLIGTANKPHDELDWLSRLANNGDAGAQLQLGLAYRDGRYGLTPDAKTGWSWLQRSAASGNAYAEDAIGSAYSKGQGTQRDMKQAEQWWRKAIKDGDRDARMHLAEALLRAGQTQEANQLLM
jgi:TPR repeat protein